MHGHALSDRRLNTAFIKAAFLYMVVMGWALRTSLPSKETQTDRQAVGLWSGENVGWLLLSSTALAAADLPLDVHALLVGAWPRYKALVGWKPPKIQFFAQLLTLLALTTLSLWWKNNGVKTQWTSLPFREIDDGRRKGLAARLSDEL